MGKDIVDLVHWWRCLLLRAGAEARAKGHGTPIKLGYLAAILFLDKDEKGDRRVSDRVWKTVGDAHKAGVDASRRQYLSSS